MKMQLWTRKKPSFLLVSSLFCVFVVASIIYNGNDWQFRVEIEAPSDTDFEALAWSKACISTRNYSVHEAGISQSSKSNNWRGSPTSCDIFSGRWVFDNASYPLYNELDCEYNSDQFACQKYGRPDLMYQKWRWQPHNCNLKRWNGTEMLEKLRGKRMMFVGDSLNRGQWTSMVCLLQSAIGDGKKSMSPNAALTIFRAEEYNATVEFHWAPLIVESNSDHPFKHRLKSRIIRPDSILKHASVWEKADIIIFNTYLWWRTGNVKLLWSSEENGVCEDLSGIEAMKFTLKTWAEWVNSTVDTHKKRVFFVTMSPTHLCRETGPIASLHNSASDSVLQLSNFSLVNKPTWDLSGVESGSQEVRNCLHEETPIEKEGFWGSGSDVPTMRVLDDVLGRLRSKVSVINITQLSEYRKDGHTSIYRKFWEKFSPERLSNPASYADCFHWCLPGVPDVWNELLFNLL